MIRKFLLNKILNKTIEKMLKKLFKTTKKRGVKKEANLWQKKCVYGIIIK